MKALTGELTIEFEQHGLEWSDPGFVDTVSLRR
jgi:hypothetical protein